MSNGDTDHIDSEVVTIPLATYKALKKDSETLAALYAGGVDGWAFHDDALKEAGL
jgi:hypothetical protein